MMNILGIETATELCSAALYCEGDIFEESQIAPRRHAELILPMLNRLLEKAGIDRTSVDAIAFGAGPGSFMGVRIATAVAQAIAYAIQCPVIPVSTLQALAQTAYDDYSVERALVAWDARMHEVYWGAYQLGKNELMEKVEEDQLSSPQKVIAPANFSSWQAVGNAWSIYRDQFCSIDLAKMDLLSDNLYPTAKSIVRIAKEKYHQGETNSPLEVEPTYLRNKVAWEPGEKK